MLKIPYTIQTFILNLNSIRRVKARMETALSTSHMKSHTPKRGKIKARIFKGIAGSVVSATTRTGGFLGLIKKEVEESDGSAPPTPPGTPTTLGD
ncbi:hypothetical protein HanIR_Chr05g0212471 [Helianthus annuus]|nr:hypothetical protein HanIR_Chr05g0212471 [Helianthus annuus]